MIRVREGSSNRPLFFAIPNGKERYHKLLTFKSGALTRSSAVRDRPLAEKATPMAFRLTGKFSTFMQTFP